MSRPPKIVKFNHREGKPCSCDNCKMYPKEPLPPGQIWVRIKCKEDRCVAINKDDLFVECQCCQETHAVYIDKSDVINRQDVYRTSGKPTPFLARCHEMIRRLRLENGEKRADIMEMERAIANKDAACRQMDMCAKTLLEAERIKKEHYKKEVNRFFKENEKAKEKLAEAKELQEKYAKQKSEDSEKIACLEKELEKTVALLKHTEAQLCVEQYETKKNVTKLESALEASKAELSSMEDEMNEVTEALDKRTKELEELKKRGEGSAETQKKLEEYKKFSTDLMKALKTKDDELERMKAEKGREDTVKDKSQSDFLAELQRSLERRERVEEEREKARFELLEAIMAKRDEEIANKFEALTQLLQASVEARTEKSSGGGQISRETTVSPPVAKKSRKRRSECLEESTSEPNGRNSAGNQDVGDHRELASEAMDSSHADDLTEPNFGATPSSSLEELQKRFLRLQEPHPMVTEPVEEGHAVKEEIVDEEEDFDEEEARASPTTEPEEIAEKDSRKAKRARMN